HSGRGGGTGVSRRRHRAAGDSAHLDPVLAPPQGKTGSPPHPPSRKYPPLKFLEYQVKERFRAAGIPVPDGRLARNPDEAALAAGALGSVVVKAQVPIGGRGKAGGIKLARTPVDAKRAAGEILGMTIKGYTVREVWCETAQEITRELYLGLTLDRDARKPVLMLSAQGGMDIEDAAEPHPAADPEP